MKPLVEKTCPNPCISEDWNLYAETPATDDFGNHCNSNIDICCVSFTPDCTRLLSFDGCAGIYARERPVSWINQSEQPIRIARFFIKGPICGAENGQVGDGLADSTLPTMEGEPRHRRMQRWHCKKGNLPTLSQIFYRDRRTSILEVPAKYLQCRNCNRSLRDLPGVVSAQLCIVRAHQTRIVNSV